MITMTSTGLRPVVLRASAAAIAIAVAAPADAQQAFDDVSLDLGTIILNARKIDETAQRVPFGLTVVTGETTEARRIDDALDLARTTPGFNLGDTGLRGSNIPNIRGVGTFFPLSADDASVPVFIDGVPLAVRSQDRAIFDVERVEVLRGPQNTLYGRNAQGGAINITTADPTFTPFYRLNVEAGEDGYGRLRAVASGPLSERLAYRFSGQFLTRDGDIPNLSSIGGDLREEDQINLNTKFLWQPDDTTDVRLSLNYGDYNGAPTQGVYQQDPDFPRAALDIKPEYELITKGLGLTVEKQFDGFRFTSVTGIQGYESRYLADDSDGILFEALTGFPAAAFEDPSADFRTIEDDDIQYSQEFRFDGNFSNGGTWVAGISAFEADLDLDLTFNATGFIQGDFENSFTTKSAGAFGEMTLPLSDRSNFIAGLRYTHEEKSFKSAFTDNSGGTLGASNSDSGSRSFDYVTGRLGLTYDLTPDVTAFASYARGAKSGGFQLADTDLANGFGVSGYESAFTDTVELGVRGTTLDGRLDFAASLFYNETENEHLQVFDLTTFQSVIENADTETYGLELEAGFQVTENLRFEGALSLLEAEIKSSADPTVETGNRVPFAPSSTLSLAIENVNDLRLFNRLGELTTRAEYQYVGSRSIDPQNRDELDSYGIVNLRLGWRHDNTEVYAFVDNAFDENYVESAFVFGNTPGGDVASLGVPGSPQRIGFGIDFTF